MKYSHHSKREVERGRVSRCIMHHRHYRTAYYACRNSNASRWYRSLACAHSSAIIKINISRCIIDTSMRWRVRSYVARRASDTSRRSARDYGTNIRALNFPFCVKSKLMFLPLAINRHNAGISSRVRARRFDKYFMSLEACAARRFECSWFVAPVKTHVTAQLRRLTACWRV